MELCSQYAFPEQSSPPTTVPQLEKEADLPPPVIPQAYAAGKGEPRWDIVQQYIPLAKSIVSKMRMYFPSYIDYEDIFSIAMAGLIAASQKFDPEKGRYFGKYAILRVRGALLDELRRLDLLPRTDRTKVKHYQKMVEDLQQKLNRKATDAEIQDYLGISISQLHTLKEKSRPLLHVPLDYSPPNEEDNPTCLHEILSDPTENNGRDKAEYRDTMAQVRDHIDRLPESFKKVLTLYYVEGLNLSEIALVFKLTESRICQIHGQAINLLREWLKNKP